MKKQNNILAVIKNIIYLVFACIALNACTDEEIYKSATVKEGIPVTIDFGLSITGMDKVTTRALHCLSPANAHAGSPDNLLL